MAIEPFRRRVGIPNAAPLVPVRTVNIPDIGRQISSAGQAIFEAGEPERIAKAQEAGRAAAEEAIIRTEDNQLVSERPETTGGIYKQQAYQQLLAQRYLTEFDFDMQQALDGFANNAEYRNNPELLNQVGRAHIEGALAQVPVEFRAQAREIAYREGNQRFSLVLNRVREEERNDLISSTINNARTLVNHYNKKAANGYSIEELIPTKNRIDEIIQSLRDYKSQEFIDSLLAEFDEQLGTADDFIQSVENTTDIIDWFHGGSANQDSLQIVINRLSGTLDEREISDDSEYAANLSTDRLFDLFPSKAIREELIQQARGQISVLNEKDREIARAAEQAAAQALLDEEYRQIGAEVTAQANAGNYNYDNKKIGWIDDRFAERIPNYEALNTEAGRRVVYEFVAEYGVLPTQAKGLFSFNLRNMDRAFEAISFYNSVHMEKTNAGVLIGDIITESILPKDRALFERIVDMSFAATRDEIELAITNSLEGRAYTVAEAITAFDANKEEPDKKYDNMRRRFFAETLRSSNGRIPRQFGETFDELYSANLNVYQGDAEKAFTVTKAQVESSLVPSSVFLNNVGLRNVINTYAGGNRQHFINILHQYLLTLTRSDGSPVLGSINPQTGRRRHTVGGENSSVKIESLDGNVEGGGRYRVHFYDVGAGTLLPSERIEFDMNDPAFQETARNYMARQPGANRPRTREEYIQDALDANAQGADEVNRYIRASQTYIPMF